MRIISGSLKGVHIPSPPGNNTRPTTDVWREAIFSALQERINFANTSILDICAGSGALGFEAISRGASSVLFVEQDVNTCKQLRLTANELGISNLVTIAKANALLFLQTPPTSVFDCCFIDAPYQTKISNAIMHRVLEHQWLSCDAYIVCEHGYQEALIAYTNVEVVWTRERGGTVVDLLHLV